MDNKLNNNIKNKLCLIMGNSMLGLEIVHQLCEHDYKDKYEKLVVAVYDIESKFKKALEKYKVHIIPLEPNNNEPLKQYIDESYIVLMKPVLRRDLSYVISTIDTLCELKVQYFGLLSWIGAKYSKGRYLGQFKCIEEHIQKKQFKYALVTNCDLFQQNLELQAPVMQDNGKMVFNIKDKSFAPVNEKDIAKACAISLTEHKSKAWNEHGGFHHIQFNGPKLVNGKELAKIASEVLDSEYEFMDASREETKRALMKNSHIKEDVIEFILDYYELIAQGYAEDPKDCLKEILGKEPEPVDVFIKNHANHFKPKK